MTKYTANFSAVLFDLDGVLVDSEGIYTTFWEQLEQKFPTGIPNFALVIKGNTLQNILNTYFKPELHPVIIDYIKEQERTMRYQLFPGVEDLLTRLRNAGKRIAIVTSSNPAKMRELFRQQPILREMVDVIITDADVTRSKPDPQGYLLAAERLGVPASECLVFEDSFAGLEAGRRAGATVVGIATTNPFPQVAAHCDLPLHQTAHFLF